MNRRSTLEIYFDVLKTLERGITKPTQIMYKANLSWESMQKIFRTLIDGGFILKETLGNVNQYHITEKGRNALVYYSKSIDGLVKVNRLVSCAQISV